MQPNIIKGRFPEITASNVPAMNATNKTTHPYLGIYGFLL